MRERERDREKEIERTRDSDSDSEYFIEQASGPFQNNTMRRT